MRATQGSVADQHRRAVLELLHEEVLTRGQLAERLGISRSSLSEVLTELLSDGAVIVAHKDADQRDGRGRPAEVLTLDPHAGHYLGIDFFHDRVVVVVTNASQEIVTTDQARYAETEPWSTRIPLALRLARASTDRAGVHLRKLQGIGVGLPGPRSALWDILDRDLPPDYTALVAEVGSAFESALGAPTFVDHHIRFAALAEAGWGRDRVTELLYLRLSAGVGGAVVAGGTPLTGAQNLAGELGHVLVRRGRRTRPCRCGRRGCLESVAATGAVLAELRRRGVAAETIAAAADLAERDEQTARIVDELADETADAVGEILGMAAVVTNPRQIILAGEVLELSEDFVHRVAERIFAETLPIGEPPRVSGTRLGEQAGALGAAMWLSHERKTMAKRGNGRRHGG